MIGIDVGATEVTHSDGSRSPHGVPGTPLDLIVRVARDVPDIRVEEHGCMLRPADELYAAVVEAAIRGRRRDPARIAVAVPAWWTPRTLDRARAALDAQGIEALLVNEAEAAVMEHRATGHRTPPTIAVVSLRAEYSSVAIVRGGTDQLAALATPVFVHEEGGHRLDAEVLRHLVRGLTDLGDIVDPADPLTVAAARGQLDRCRELREALSVSAVESVQPELPGADHRLRLVRSELEELATPWADAVTRMVSAALAHYGHPVDALLLVGGMASMPMVSQRLSAELTLEVIVAQDPQLAVARGARRVLAEEMSRRAVATSPRRARWRSRTRTRASGKRRRGGEAGNGASLPLPVLPPGSLDDAAPERLVDEFVPAARDGGRTTGHEQLIS